MASEDRIEIVAYQLKWHEDQDKCRIECRLEDGNTVRINLRSAAEGSLLMDTLRNEKPVYYRSNFLSTGMEETGEEEGKH